MPKTPGRPWEILEGVTPAPRTILPWSPKRARIRWLAEYARLFEENA
jgi:hypothetical protein